MIATNLDPTASRAVLVVDTDLVRGLSLRFVLAKHGYDVVQAFNDGVAETLIEKGLCAAVVWLTSKQFQSSQIIESLLEQQIPVLVLLSSDARSCQQTYAAAVIQPGNPSIQTIMALIGGMVMAELRS